VDLFKGVTFGYYGRNGYYSSPAARAEIDKIASLNVPWICLISTIMQEAYYSTRMFRDFFMTPGDDELVEMINYIHAKGIKVMFRPMIECWDGTQRCHLHMMDGEVFPDRPYHYQTDWFKNYMDVTRHYLRIARNTGCEGYCLDSELNPLAGLSDNWNSIVAEARKLYKGHLTTSMICIWAQLELLDNPDCWYYALDSVGTSMYDQASVKGGGTIEEMVEYFKNSGMIERHRTFAAKYGKPYYFGECGCCSTENASRLPYYWKNGKHYSGREQANFMEAVIKTYSPEPWWNGMFWWKWDENNFRAEFVEDPAGDKGFTIWSKPAVEVMRKWCLVKI